jgi:hypothetical protein
MSGYPDDRFDDPRPLPSRSRNIEAVRVSLTPPAVFLILNSLLGLAFVAAMSVPMVFNPNAIPDFMRDMAAQQPPGPERADLEKKTEEFENALNADRDAFIRNNAIQLAIPAAANLLVLFGALCMRGLSAYMFCLLTAVIAMVPCLTGCCITGLPFGLWALLVLIRPDVREAFSIGNSVPPPDPDAEYLR